jgi:transaldolase/glucose-6-phosphate isomerase
MSEREGAWTDGQGLQMSLVQAEEGVAVRMRRWEEERIGQRLWGKDHTVWSPEPVPELTDRLGWLTLPDSMEAELPRLESFAAEARADGIERVFVLGMGGSSLAPDVYSLVFGARPGFPELRVLDTTHPDAVERSSRDVDPARTLFLVSSKSGTTLETLSLFRFSWEMTVERLGGDRAGRQFVAITDPGSSLERLAAERGFRAVFNAPPDVGGRYSALTNFGLVPAALIGVDVRGLLERARAMERACGPEVPVGRNPGLALGAALGELALAGRDKLTFVTTPSLASFPDWIEQLVAESTGKHGQGIVPVVGEPLGRPEVYGEDRVFAALLLDGEETELEPQLAELQAAGHPVLHFHLSDRLDLGREMYRWELATAAAGAALGINPFDQPDVQLAKELASRAMKEQAERGSSRAAQGDATDAVDAAAVSAALRPWLEGVQPGDYLGLQAYLVPGGGVEESLRLIQAALRDFSRVAVTVGYGPRFLHSTGQLHKGGPLRCRFLQLVDQPGRGLPVPETDFEFAALIRAQADGDRQALEQRGRQVLRLQLGADPAAGFRAIREALGIHEGGPTSNIDDDETVLGEGARRVVR